MSDVTRIFASIGNDDPATSEQLLPIVYDELRRMAARKMAAEPAGHTLQPTALVHEAWLRLVDPPHQTWQNRAHFFGAAAEAMRRILIARARRKMAQRRGARAVHVPIDDVEVAAPVPEDELLALNEALERFEAVDPRQAALVKLRYFAGLTLEEAAEVLGVSESTVKRGWAYAKAWLYHEIRNPEGNQGTH